MSNRTESKFVIENIFGVPGDAIAFGVLSILWTMILVLLWLLIVVASLSVQRIMISLYVPSSVDRHTPCSTMSVDIILD